MEELRRLELAAERLQKLAASNAPLGSRQGAETNYSNAYQACVRVGIKPQIRAKYRIAR